MPEETVVLPLIRPEYLNHHVTLFAGQIRHEQTGCSFSSRSFVENLETVLGRILRPKKAWKRPKEKQKYVWCPQI